MPRAADLGIRIGSLPTGPTNSVLDVAGRRARPRHRVRDEPDRPRAVASPAPASPWSILGGDASAAPVPAGVRGAQRRRRAAPGRSQVDEWGSAETPVFLTSTMQVGRVYDAACRLLMAEQPAIGVDDVIIPVVGECDDSWLNQRATCTSRTRTSRPRCPGAALGGSTRAPEQGAVGAGTGMCCFGWKGGIGTASRVLPDGHVSASCC